MAVYYGDALAARAWNIAKLEDPDRDGITVTDLLTAIVRHGDDVRGENPAIVLRSALNRNQHIWAHPARGTWTWMETATFDPTAGLSGHDLADAAHAVARRIDPSQQGVHYERIATELRRSGVAIRGPQAGGTLMRSMQSSGRFERSPDRDGAWTWR